MATDREKEREAELESAMYTNCLLLGLDPAVIGGGGSGGSGGASRVGRFRHSNPRLGEQLLYFLLSALRGPVQSAKDFDKVWPIFDSTQSREFRKIVQGIISDLESQGALPRSSSRVSSLATCCGPRFVELLWQLSVHALREVHKRTFTADVASDPLPPSLTDASYLNAAALLPVTKARIALERRKFLENANKSVHRQAAWSDLAHEMTAEFRSLCAEEAYLQQELEKLQDTRNKAKLEGELCDDRISSSSQTPHLVSKATRLWESLLARQSQHEVLASGPIEDLIAHREHRYRISGSSLLAAMDLSSNLPHSDVLSVHDLEASSALVTQGKKDSYQIQEQSDALPKMDDRSGRVHPTVDVAEVLRRWTHALQRIHKQSLNLVKANDGEGPDILYNASDGCSGGHAESLAATLAEHRQHLVSIQGLIDQLNEAIPTMQQSISELTEEVNNISTSVDGFGAHSTTIPSESIGRPLESIGDDVADITSKLSSTHLEKCSNSPTLKLPHLFNVTPNSSAKGTHATKRRTATLPVHQQSVPAQKAATTKHPSDTDGESKESADKYAQNIRRSVREAALSSLSSKSVFQDRSNDDGSEHFFISLPTDDCSTNQIKQQFISSTPESQTLQGKLNWHKECTNNCSLSDTSQDGTLDQVFSPPLLLESPFYQDAYEDLLAPLSETDAALMEH
ncbi:AUGMIN subunit 6-like [Zingiber officinale]|uniref:AUGMIN subunit 6-like n=1 Tax=Zingiber officinale TaxID=94328 RepID=UPI001C4D1CB6|nr:AUGMIN subunit 6-like [Zingiber officinale]